LRITALAYRSTKMFIVSQKKLSLFRKTDPEDAEVVDLPDRVVERDAGLDSRS